ncbi:MAG: hypothetical protein ACK56W_20085 [Pirellula sp.]|jgi:hypothetical protein|nr:hypothetical protein [Pirellula sp.]
MAFYDPNSCGLARSHSVACTSERLTPEMLSDLDMLILKSPEAVFDAAELVAIETWLTKGGVVVLIVDHTGLMGMNSRLNELARPNGISFNADAVSTLAQYFLPNSYELFAENWPNRQSTP